MEGRQNVNSSIPEDGFPMKSLDQRESTKSHNDINARRMKNRERQRRYRERKRLQADTKKLSIHNQPKPPQVEEHVNGIVNNCANRVYCQRDWKKDARSGHTVKEPELVSNVHVISDLRSAVESECRSKSSPLLGNSDTERIASGGRHWKAEARNKKN